MSDIIRNDLQTTHPKEAKTYLVSDGVDVWTAFKSLGSGGWWLQRPHALPGENPYIIEKRNITHFAELPEPPKMKA